VELAGAANWKHADRNLYVVDLRPEVFERERNFFEANLHWLPGKLAGEMALAGEQATRLDALATKWS